MVSKLGTIHNPIRCAEPIGEWRYLSQLVSEIHGHIQYVRIGSFKVGGTLLDGYVILDLAGKKIAELYFDMYHPGYVEGSVPEGFSRIDPKLLEDQLFAKMFGATGMSSELQAQVTIGQENYGYVEAKAQRLLLCGPLYYRTHDYFGYPLEDWNWEGIVDASRQLVEDFSGRLKNNPITVVNALIAEQLLKTFHFDCSNVGLLDSTEEPVVLCATHKVTGESLQCWFQRSTFERENLP